MPTSEEPPEPARRPDDAAPLQEWTLFQLRHQAAACRKLGSELYAFLLEAAADDVAESGPAWQVLAAHADRGLDSALGLRFMAAVHRLVLQRQAPELALTYPSVGGTGDAAAAWPALLRLLVEKGAQISELVGLPCQTNEVGRSCALLPGFLLAAAETGLPLRTLEIGASGGLNLRWDRFRYENETDARAWGDPQSPVQLRGPWDVPAHLLSVPVTVAARSGCDPRPVDAASAEGRLALSASVWADQPARFARLRGALQIAAEVPVTVEQESAATWLPRRLSTPSPGHATVVYHSVVMQYLHPDDRDRVVQAIATAGADTTADTPLYWLRMEPDDPLSGRGMAVRLTSWPGGQERLLATAGAHGFPVRWHGS